MEIKTNTEIFLKELHVESISEKNDYILQEEFKKTPKNTNWKVLIILTVMVLALGAASFGISRWIAARNIITDYNLDEFQDVDLMSVLSQVKKLEKRKEEAERELLLLRRDYKSEISKIENIFKQDITLLKSKGLGEDLFEERQLSLTRLRGQDLERVDNFYKNEILLKEEEVNLFKEQIKEFDSDKIQQAQEYENIMANEEKKFKLEMELLIEKYETQLKQKDEQYSNEIDALLRFQDELQETLKETGLSDMLEQKDIYNPKLPEVNNRFTRAVNDSVDKSKYVNNLIEIKELIIDSEVLESSFLTSLESDIADWNVLVNFINDIPFENVVPKILSQLDARYFRVIDNLGLELINISNKNIESINNIHYKLEHLEKTLHKYKFFYTLQKQSFAHQIELLGGGDGFIIESAEDKLLYAFMDPFLELKDQSKAHVYNDNNQFVGVVLLSESGLFHTVTPMDSDKNFEIYNKIFLERGEN